MEADIVCVGFGPATGGFLTTLSRSLLNADGTPIAESRVAPGLPPQVICFERADDISFGVSGVVTRARGIRSSFSDLDIGQIPMAAPVTDERMVYLLDEVGASRRSRALRAADALIRAFKRVLPYEEDALTLPFVPSFLRKDGGLLLSIGQFMQWVGGQVLASGAVQVWPGTPVASPLVEDGRVIGVRLVDQGTDRRGNPGAGFTAGLDVHAELTVVGDGPVGPIGRQLDERFGVPPGHRRHDWAVGMKMVVELAEDADVAPGSVVHTFGYPEPEIFGFMPNVSGSGGLARDASCRRGSEPGANRLSVLQLDAAPVLWRYLRGGTLRSGSAEVDQSQAARRAHRRRRCARVGRDEAPPTS
jgi:electron-transferring-flavoprotein dehydrogenase